MVKDKVIAIEATCELLKDPTAVQAFMFGLPKNFKVVVFSRDYGNGRGEMGHALVNGAKGIDHVIVLKSPAGLIGASARDAVYNELTRHGYDVTVLVMDEAKPDEDSILVVFKEVCSECGTLCSPEDSRIMSSQDLENMKFADAEDDKIEYYSTTGSGRYKHVARSDSSGTCRTC